MKVSGIDFSGVENFKEAVTVRLPNGTDVELPLITLRDAPIAMSFLRENDMIATKYSIIATKSMNRSAALNAMKEQSDDTEVSDEDINALSTTTDALMTMQKELRDVHRELVKLCDAIIEFISPYFKDKSIIEYLKTCEGIYVVKVLQLMLDGKDAVAESQEDDSEENPTTMPSQNS
jgi:hypothetical protein